MGVRLRGPLLARQSNSLYKTLSLSLSPYLSLSLSLSLSVSVSLSLCLCVCLSLSLFLSLSLSPSLSLSFSLFSLSLSLSLSLALALSLSLSLSLPSSLSLSLSLRLSFSLSLCHSLSLSLSLSLCLSFSHFASKSVSWSIHGTETAVSPSKQKWTNQHSYLSWLFFLHNSYTCTSTDKTLCRDFAMPQRPTWTEWSADQTFIELHTRVTSFSMQSVESPTSLNAVPVLWQPAESESLAIHRLLRT